MAAASDHKIKILHPVSSAELAGTERALLMLIDGGARERFRHVVALPERGPLLEQLEKRNAEFIIIERGGFSPSYHARLAAAMLRLRPHILHVHYSRIDAITARALGVKVVGRKNLTREAHHRTASRLPLFDRLAEMSVQAIITPSEFTRNDYIERGLARPERIFTIYNGIDPASFKGPFDKAAELEEFGLSPGALLITAVGRLVPLKGLADVVSAMPEISGQFPNAKLLLVDDGHPRKLRDRNPRKNRPARARALARRNRRGRATGPVGCRSHRVHLLKRPRARRR